MSTYRYETDSDSIDIREGAIGTNVFIWVHEGRKEAAILIPKADIPTVALELLKAAGQESVIVPKAYEEVATKGFGDLECGSGPETAYGNINDNPNWHRNRAANSIAIAECLEAAAARDATAKAEAGAAEKKLQERQAAVLKELGHGYTYDQLGPNAPMRKAVDRIIELATILEDGASRD